MSILGAAAEVVAIGGTVIEGICLASFWLGRSVRVLPLVSLFIASQFVSDAVLVWVSHSKDIWPLLVGSTYAGYLFEAAALWELAVKLQGNSLGRSPAKLRTVGFLVMSAAALAVYFLQNDNSYNDFGRAEQTFLHIDLSISIFRVLALVTILGLARSKYARRNSLPLKITIGFALYAVCCLLKHAFNEIAPHWKVASVYFTASELACGCIWIAVLSWISVGAVQLTFNSENAKILKTS